MNGLLTAWFLAASLAGTADPQEAVRSGQRALDHWGRYPWYDAKTDSLRPLDLSPPWWEAWIPDLQGVSWRPWSTGSLLQWAAWILIALVLALMVYFLVRTFRARHTAHTAQQSAGTASDAAEERRRVEALPLSPTRRGFDLLAEAEEQYRLGHYSQAIVYLFSHQLVQLDKHQLIHLSKGKTNRQYLRELGARKPLRHLLERTMITFEDVFFGQHAIDRRRFETCWDRLDEFESLTSERLA